jgi:hypothetical protein
MSGFETTRKRLGTNNLAIRFSLKMKYNGVAAAYLAIKLVVLQKIESLIDYRFSSIDQSDNGR